MDRSNAGPEELTAAIAALSSFQQVTQQADGKAGTLLAVQVGIAVAVTTHLDNPVIHNGHGAVRLCFWFLLASYLCCSVMCGYHLGQAIRPRLGPAGRTNRFAIVSGPDRARGSDFPDQIWSTAAVVAEIARIKNGHLVRLVSWTAPMVVSAMGWLALVSWAGGR